jgi:hypothetical protein
MEFREISSRGWTSENYWMLGADCRVLNPAIKLT